MRGVEPEPLENGVDTRSYRVSSLALESFEVAPVSRQCCSVAHFRQCVGLLGERLLEREQFGEWACRCFPDSCGDPEVAVLTEQ